MSESLDIREGAIVWLEEDGALEARAVLSSRGGSVEGLSTAGERRALALRRVVHVSGERLNEPTAEALGRHLERVASLRDEVDLATTWELLRDEGGEHGLDDLCELALDRADAVARDALRLTLHEEPAYFRERRARWSPASASSVEETLRRRDREAQAQAELSRQAASIVARLAGEDDAAGDADCAEGGRLLEELAVHGDEASRAKKALELLAAVTERQPRNPERTAFELLVRLGLLDEDEDLNLRRFRIRTSFPDEVLAGAADASWSPEARRDFSALYTVAIDDEGTTEVDDALALEHDGDDRFVHVFIADPAAFVTEGDAIDIEARRRGATLYHPVQRYPMLPVPLGEQAASLVTGERRPALAFSTRFDDAGEVTGFAVQEAMIRVDRQITYDTVDALLEAEVPATEDDVPLTDLLRGLLDVAEGERARRLHQGALVFERTEITVRVDDDRRVHRKRLETGAASRRIVSEHMILACSQAAAFCRDERIPTVYRKQAPPDEPLEWSPEMSADLPAMDAAMRRLKKAELSLHPHRHHSLGVEAYTQVTSPLRRYQDLVMHRQLKAHLRGEPPPHSDDDLMAVFAEVEANTSRYGRTEGDARRYWLLRHLQQEEVDEVEVVVRRALGKRMLVQIEDYGLNATFSPRSEVAPGDRLTLRVSTVDPRGDVLILSE